MKFKENNEARLSKEFEKLQPELKRIVALLDAWLISHNLPCVTVTHVLRTPRQQEDIYWRLIQESEKCSEKTARAIARGKFTWHLVGCAVDIRNKSYTKSQIDQILYFLSTIDVDTFSFLSHDVRRGSHFHLQIKDKNWRLKI